MGSEEEKKPSVSSIFMDWPDFVNVNPDRPTDWPAFREGIKRKVFGQNHVIDGLTTQLKRRHAMSQLKNTTKPLALFLFTGPRGVGKTYLSKVLGENIYDGKGKVHWIDMAQYHQSHELTSLLGTPAGYGGGEGSLTGALAKNPKLVILLDDFERAHKDVQEIFLKGWLDGYFTDRRTEKQVPVNRAIFLVTTGQAGDRLVEIEQALKDDAPARNLAIAEVLKGEGWSLEMLALMDHIFVFMPLDMKDLAHVAMHEIFKLAKRYELTVTKIEARYLVALVSNEDMENGNARCLGRKLELQLGDQMAALKATGAGRIEVSFVDGSPVVHSVEDQVDKSPPT